MKHILDPKQLRALFSFAQAKTALVFDYDGTLVPIVNNPFHTKISPRTKKLLRTISKQYPTALLSGRSLRDVQRKGSGAGFHEFVGNHGIEFSHSKATSKYAARAAGWVKKYAEAIHDGRIDAKGLQLEDKIVSLSIHYRHCRNTAVTKRELLRFFKGLRGVRVVGGKYVFNLLPNIRKNKGTAIGELRKLLKSDHVVYFGDDVTDEDVFALKDKRKLLDIRIGRSKKTKARYYLRDQSEMNELLKRLIELRNSKPTRRIAASAGVPAGREKASSVRLLGRVNSVGRKKSRRSRRR